MKSSILQLVTIGLMASGLCCEAFAGERLMVELSDGRTLTANVDSRSNENRLWLRFGGGTTVVLRAIAWDRVARVSLRGTPLTVERILELAAADRETPELVTTSAPANPPRPDQQTDADRARQFLGFRAPTTAVQFDAWLAHWDGDVPADGLLVHIQPTDESGRLTPLSGVLQVELVAMKTVAFHHAPHSRGELPRRVGTWTVDIDERDFDSAGLSVKLPFQAAHPELDTDWAAHGLVHLRLVIPGQGVFEHSLDALRIRPFAPLRDALQRQSGKRFLPTEAGGQRQKTGG